MHKEDKNKSLVKLINSLSEESDYSKKTKVEEDINLIIDIYQNGFRHSYSDISLCIQEIITNREKNENLTSNLVFLKEKIDARKDLDSTFYKAFTKLYDHINLEIGRYNFYTRIVKNLESPVDVKDKDLIKNKDVKEKIKQNKKDINKIRPVIQRFQQTLEKVDLANENIDQKLARNSVSSITSLTIFSAIIIAFTGGFNYVSSIFSSTISFSKYRLIFMIASVGFILFNVIFLLLYIVCKMNDKNIETKCKYSTSDKQFCNNKCGNYYCTKRMHFATFSCRLVHKYPYILFVNVVILLLMYYDVVLATKDIHNVFMFGSNLTYFHLLVLLPLLFFIVILIVKVIKKWFQLRKNYLAEALEWVENYIKYKKKLFNSIQQALETVQERLSQIMGNSVDSQDVDFREIEQLINTFNNKKNMELKVIRQLKKEFKLEFARGIKNLKYVTYYEHRQNKRKIKRLIIQLGKETSAIEVPQKVTTEECDESNAS